ncbi:hypothetical protein [Winogradskyella sp.]|uniref:hypothetical protein n=1 Tax=Winogradskyella sp. TaxID=1883156 RepID=UPI002610027E|nr:hypothetical protein [Winogradskyella sp.]
MNNTVSFLLLTVITLCFGVISKNLLNTEALFVNSLAEQLTAQQIEELFEIQKKWEWLGYAIIPLLLLLKIVIISAIIDLGCFLFNLKLKYRKIFGMVTKAEFVFLLVIVCKTLWFYFFKDNYTLEDLQYFYPLSALSMVGYEGIDAWWIYPLQTFNLFELAYWLILGYLLGKALNKTTDKGLSIVASSYGVGLLIWVVGVMFFTLNMS